MKRLLRKTFCLLCIYTFLLPGTHVRAQNGQQAKQYLETYVTVVSKVYPPAGGVFGAMLKMLDFTGYFGKSKDPVAEAFKIIDGRLAQHDAQIAKLQRDVQDLRQGQLGERNWNRFKDLEASRNKLRTVNETLADLRKENAEKSRKTELVGDARAEAARFLDVELWMWSDLSKQDQSWTNRLGRTASYRSGEMTAPDFKSMPTLEYYTSALVAWMATMEYASDGNAAEIRQRHGADIERHIAWLSKRPSWNDQTSQDPPQTLPEMIMDRVHGEWGLEKYPSNGACHYWGVVRDDMRRALSTEEPQSYPVAANNQLCNVPAGKQRTAPQLERDREREYGLDVMSSLATLLKAVRDKGTVSGTSVATVRPPATPPKTPTGPVFSDFKFDTSTTADDFNLLYTVSPDGTLTWHRHMIRYPNGRNGRPTHAFNPPKTIGSGWAGGVKKVMPMGQLGIYTLWEDGRLSWYWHRGALDGSYNWAEPPRELAKGWNAFKDVIAQDKGVFYMVLPDGRLLWNMTSSYDGRRGTPKVGSGLLVGGQYAPNANMFKTMFGGGNGVLYAIGHDGQLYWMRHNRYLAPTPNLPPVPSPLLPQFELARTEWTPPVRVASGMAGVIHAFSPGEGHIYYVNSDGQLIYRRHIGWDKGNTTWDANSGVVIANNWGSYKFAFARNTTSDAGSGNPAVDIVVK